MTVNNKPILRVLIFVQLSPRASRGLAVLQVRKICQVAPGMCSAGCWWCLDPLIFQLSTVGVATVITHLLSLPFYYSGTCRGGRRCYIVKQACCIALAVVVITTTLAMGSVLNWFDGDNTGILIPDACSQLRSRSSSPWGAWLFFWLFSKKWR